MKKILLLLTVLFVFANANAQEDNEKSADVSIEDAPVDLDTYFIDHVTTMGERLVMVSKKYMVDPQEIYKYNIVASDKNGMVPGQTLKIPLHESKKKDLEKFKEELIKKNGGNPIQVAPVPPIKKKEEDAEEEE
jgi:hypothetical protein